MDLKADEAIIWVVCIFTFPYAFLFIFLGIMELVR